jgi:hypothetical protein
METTKGLTVSQLIRKLSQCAPNALVTQQTTVNGYEWEWQAVTGIVSDGERVEII